MKTILDIARNKPTRANDKTKITDEYIEFSLSWMKDEITFTQARQAMKERDGKGRYGTALYQLFAVNIREAYRRGLVATQPPNNQ